MPYLVFSSDREVELKRKFGINPDGSVFYGNAQLKPNSYYTKFTYLGKPLHMNVHGKPTEKYPSYIDIDFYSEYGRITLSWVCTKTQLIDSILTLCAEEALELEDVGVTSPYATFISKTPYHE